MKRLASLILISLIGLLGADAIASAVLADGSASRARAPAAAPLPAAVSSGAFSWSGFFVGGNLGGAWSDINHTVTFTNGNTQRFNFDPESVAGGVQFIAQRQWNNLVLGLEVGLTGFDFAQSRNASINVAADRTRQSDIDSLFTLAPRIGYAADKWLVYLKGGYANAEVFRGTTVSSTSFQLTGTNRREDGWTIGAGYEVAMLPWVTLGLDYSFVSIDPKARPGSPQFLAPNITAGTAIVSDAEIHLLTARVNFKVGGL